MASTVRVVACCVVRSGPDSDATAGWVPNSCVPTTYALPETAATASRQKAMTETSFATSSSVRPTGRTSR